ncbi:MAG: sensor histidine kinase [Lachnospirales bacterium]
MKRLKQSFRNFKLKQKFAIFYSTLFIIPLIFVSMIIYVEVSKHMLEKIQYSAVQGYEQSKEYLNYKIFELIQRTDVIATNNNLKNIIQDELIKSADPHRQMLLNKEIISYIQSVESGAQGINIKIYVDDKFTLLKDGKYVYHLSDAINSLWYKNKGNRKIYFAPNIYLENTDGCVALVRDITKIDNYKMRSFVLRMDIDVENIVSILCNATPTENSVTFIVNEENTIIAASNYESLPISLNKFGYSKYDFTGKLTEGKLAGKQIYFLRDKIKNTNWEMVTIIPRSDLTQGISGLQYKVAGLLMFFGILTVIIGALIVSWVVGKITLLNESFNQVKDGDIDVYLPCDTKDELGILYENYNEMIRNTKNLIDEKYNIGIELKSAELKALQSQINPHFLYNTLDMLNWLTFNDRKNDIHIAVVALSKYYRLILNGGEENLTLKKEIMHVNCYIKIQKLRFENKITYIEEVDENIYYCVVPKIILQPLVENAIIHGICEKNSKSGIISIIGYRESNSIFIKIIDDGVGMSSNMLLNILKDEANLNGDGSYGVKNVNERIKLMFGESYGLIYESQLGKGTCVTVKLPFILA